MRGLKKSQDGTFEQNGNKQNKTTYIDCWFISSRFLDQAIEDYLTNKED